MPHKFQKIAHSVSQSTLKNWGGHIVCGIVLVVALVHWIEEGQAQVFCLWVGNVGQGLEEEVDLASTLVKGILVALQWVGTVHTCILIPRVHCSFAFTRYVGLNSCSDMASIHERPPPVFESLSCVLTQESHLKPTTNVLPASRLSVPYYFVIILLPPSRIPEI